MPNGMCLNMQFLPACTLTSNVSCDERDRLPRVSQPAVPAHMRCTIVGGPENVLPPNEASLGGKIRYAGVLQKMYEKSGGE